MPTARELLDQADALMRRNRSPVRDDIPVLTEAVPPETAAQMTQSGHLTDGLGEARRRFEAPLTVRDEWDDVPVLTDVVSAEIHVPLASIDAVEEIDVPSVFDPSEPGGEPSAWLDFDDDGARSVIDAAADSIVVVPDIEAPGPGRGESGVERDFDWELQSAGRDEGAYIEPQPAQSEDGAVCTAGIAAQPEEAVFFEKAAESDEAIAVTDLSMRHDATGEEPTGFHDGGINELTIPEHDAVDEPTSLYAEAGVREETAAQADELVVIHAFAPQPDEPVVIHEFAAQPDASVVSEEFAAQPDESVVIHAFAPQPDESVVIHAFAPQPDEPVVILEFASQPEETAGVEAIDLPLRPVIEESTPPAAAHLAHDDAHWQAIAEEIQMQVLQRIDLFTDTGLREQLAVHLQPIVDRASADLVTTINREVGELLRAYVAEAIEREIERWRQEKGEMR